MFHLLPPVLYSVFYKDTSVYCVTDRAIDQSNVPKTKNSMYKILFILLLGCLATACMNSSYIDRPDQYFNLLGESKAFENFVNQLEPKETPQLSNQFWNDEFPKLDFYDQSLIFPQNGIEMLLKNKKIVSIKLYLPDQAVSFANYKGHKLPPRSFQ